MKRLAFAAALMAAATGRASADWEYARWGMTAEQVVAASGGKARPMPPARRYRSDEDRYEITVESSVAGPPRLSVGFQFDLPGGGLRCVLINATGDDADALRSQLLQRYGKPVEDSAFGSVRTLRWSTPDAVELAVNASPKAAVVNHCAPGKS